MTKKVYNLIVGVLVGICAIANAIVAYINPDYTPIIIASIGIAETAIVEICSLFVKQE